MKRLYTTMIIAGLTLTGACFAANKVSNLPVSSQASFIESYSPSEVTIQATGLGSKGGFFRDDMVKNASLDLRKAAVNFVLKLGTDPMLNTPDAKSKFDANAEEFFKNDNVSKYVSWEADRVISTVKTTLPDGKEGMKITKMVRVNKKLLSDDLAAAGTIQSANDIASLIGNPFIMVIPETPKGQTPIQVLDANPLAKQAAGAIESYLTARKYDVVVPQATEQLGEMTKLQSELKGQAEDISYQLALALGSDVYIVYAGSVKENKASVIVKAYETSTARLLGTETGYSQQRPGPSEPLVEEAVNDAIDKVLSRVTAYWLDDVKKGLQYKVILKFSTDFGKDDIESVQEKVSDVIDEMFATSKENVVTDQTMDLLVWAKKDEYSKSSKIVTAFKSKMKGTAKVEKINVNKKLVILAVNPE